MDLYLTVAVAIGFPILNLLGSVSDEFLPPLTLAVLSLLAITSLINRHRIDDLHQTLIGSPTDLFMEEFPEDLKSNLELAAELWLVGVSLHRTINFNYATLERKLRQGHRVRVLIVHPQGPGVEMAVSRNYTRKQVAVTSSKIAPTHPDEVLLHEFLKPLSLSQNRLARNMRVPARRINEIVQGKRRITSDTALRLARYFDMSPQV